MLGIISALKDFPKDEIHVTDLLTCLRSVYLSKNVDVSNSPVNLYWLFRGKLTHSLVDKYKSDKRNVVETKFTRVLCEILIVGTPDIILPHLKTIRDYKTCKAVPRFDVPYSNHKEQLQAYKWLVAPQHPDIKHLEIGYLDMRTAKLCAVPKPMTNEQTVKWLEPRAKRLHLALTEDILPEVEEGYPGHWKCNGYCAYAEVCAELWREEKK